MCPNLKEFIKFLKKTANLFVLFLNDSKQIESRFRQLNREKEAQTH